MKKAGYSNTFIFELINDKAEHLAFYFIINGCNDINKISEELYDYITIYSVSSYDKTVEELSKNYSEFKSLKILNGTKYLFLLCIIVKHKT